MKFFIYKLYRIAVAQKTANTIVAFLAYLYAIEILHVAIMIVALKLFGVELGLDESKAVIYGILSIMICSFFNYLFLIRNKRIYEINSFYQNKNIKGWKGNLMVISYIVLIFVILFIETLIYQHVKGLN